MFDVWLCLNGTAIKVNEQNIGYRLTNKSISINIIQCIFPKNRLLYNFYFLAKIYSFT